MKKVFAKGLKEFILGVLAGVSISIGCIAFLSSGNKIVGSLFFVIGLFMILNFNFNLFTGKVCYALDNKPSYLGVLALTWIGNFAGTLLTSLLIKGTRLTSVIDANQVLVETKLNDNLLSIFLLAIMCNILIYLAVYGYKNFDNIIAKTLALIFGVSVFVLCGFEHCVADMFYFFLAGAWSWKMIGYLLMITLGNCVGGLLIPAITKLIKFLDNKSKDEENK